MQNERVGQGTETRPELYRRDTGCGAHEGGACSFRRFPVPLVAQILEDQLLCYTRILHTDTQGLDEYSIVMPVYSGIS